MYCEKTKTNTSLKDEIMKLTHEEMESLITAIYRANNYDEITEFKKPVLNKLFNKLKV